MSNSSTPDVVKMKDTDKQLYTVDEDMASLLMNRKVWTDEQGVLYIREQSLYTKDTFYDHPLAIWILRIYTSQDIPWGSDLTPYMKCRDLTYANLQRIHAYRKESV